MIAGVLYSSRFGGCVLISSCNFKLFFLKNNEAGHLSLYSLATWLFSFVKCISSHLHIFSLAISPLSDVSIVKVFWQPAACLPLDSFRARVAQ